MSRKTFLVLLAVLSAALPGTAQQITRAWFTPPVVAEGSTKPVRFEATVTGKAVTVNFDMKGVLRPLSDDGKNGDAVAGDGTWAILFQPQEILKVNTPNRVFRPFLGFCKAGSVALNVFAEVWTPQIGLCPVRALGRDAQESDYVVNYAATREQLLKFDARTWSQLFYQKHGDDFDFLNFVLVTGTRGNRYHAGVRNDVKGIGKGIQDAGAQYGSRGTLKGFTLFPIPSFFDGGAKDFNHETGHQWVNFLRGTPFEGGAPHWPKGNIASNVMGFSITGPSSQGGDFPIVFKPDGAGGYSVVRSEPEERETFNMMELYLMGLAKPEEVGTYLVLKDQQRNVQPGQKLVASDVTKATVQDVIAVCGPRIPDSLKSQKTFRSATIVLSEGLLDAHAMSLYDYFAKRSESKTPLPFAMGFATGTAKPWHLATGGRSTMISRITPGR